MQEIERIHRGIDAIDDRIVQLLHVRASGVIAIGHFKRLLGRPIRDVRRERQVLARLARQARGPLDITTLRRIYRAIFAASRDIQRRRVTRGHRIAGSGRPRLRRHGGQS